MIENNDIGGFQFLEGHEWPSRQQFHQYCDSCTPFTIRAKRNFSLNLEFLKREDVNIDVSCVCGTEEFRGNVNEREKVTLKLSTFIDAFQHLSENRHHFLENTGLSLYLSQCTVFSSNKDTPVDIDKVSINDLQLPKELREFQLDYEQINIWLNLQESRSSLHYDSYNNFLVVNHGSKIVTMIPPSYTDHLKPYPIISTSSANHSFMSHNEVVSLTNIIKYDIELSSGDVLFIPEGWWHTVLSARCTYAVNIWIPGNISLFIQRNKQMNNYMLRCMIHNILKEKEKESNISGDYWHAVKVQSLRHYRNLFK
jgi:lysine-specific demethylase 8